jgi:hypothetical protein
MVERIASEGLVGKEVNKKTNRLIWEDNIKMNIREIKWEYV